MGDVPSVQQGREGRAKTVGGLEPVLARSYGCAPFVGVSLRSQLPAYPAGTSRVSRGGLAAAAARDP